jgi:hypothetical protein
MKEALRSKRVTKGVEAKSSSKNMKDNGEQESEDKVVRIFSLKP